MKRIAWFTHDWSVNEYRTEHDLYGGIGYYRVIKPAQVLRKWYDIEVIGAKFREWGVKGGDEALKYQRLEQYDLIMSKHLKDAQMGSNLLATAKYYKKNIIVDVDDNYLAIRKNNPAIKDYDIGEQGRYNLNAFVSLASGITTSTLPLKKVFKDLNKKIDILPNCNDLNDWPNVRKQWDDGKIRIGYAGAQGHLDDLELVIEPMAYILAKYPNVVFELIGALWPTEAMKMANKMSEYCKKDVSKQIRIAGGTFAWEGYPELLASCGWDIGICPLIDDVFNKSKSHIKWMEYGSVFAATVASPVYPYKQSIDGVKTIQDGVTGMFAETAEQWFEKLDSLIKDKDLRYQIATNANEYIKNNWQYYQWENTFKKVIEKYV